jgi:hypothetical protein
MLETADDDPLYPVSMRERVFEGSFRGNGSSDTTQLKAPDSD